MGDGVGMVGEDFHSYERPEDLVGDRAFMEELQRVMHAISGTTTGPPRERGEPSASEAAGDVE